MKKLAYRQYKLVPVEELPRLLPKPTPPTPTPIAEARELTAEDFDEILKAVPHDLQPKSQALLMYLLQRRPPALLTKPEDGFSVVYPTDGVLGSPLPTLLEHASAPDASSPPWDYLRFAEILGKLPLPRSLTKTTKKTKKRKWERLF